MPNHGERYEECAGNFLATSFLAGIAVGQPLQRKDFGTTLVSWPIEQYVLTNNSGVFRAGESPSGGAIAHDNPTFLTFGQAD